MNLSVLLGNRHGTLPGSSNEELYEISRCRASFICQIFLPSCGLQHHLGLISFSTIPEFGSDFDVFTRITDVAVVACNYNRYSSRAQSQGSRYDVAKSEVSSAISHRTLGLPLLSKNLISLPGNSSGCFQMLSLDLDSLPWILGSLGGRPPKAW